MKVKLMGGRSEVCEWGEFGDEGLGVTFVGGNDR